MSYGPVPKDPIGNFMVYVRLSPSGCWEWAGYRNPGGYGQFGPLAPKASRLAHRFLYEAVYGALPKALHLDHLCRNRACVNFKHLEPVTLAENNRRGVDFKWAARGGLCLHGHANIGRNNLGHRYCRDCDGVSRRKRKLVEKQLRQANLADVRQMEKNK